MIAQKFFQKCAPLISLLFIAGCDERPQHFEIPPGGAGNASLNSPELGITPPDGPTPARLEIVEGTNYDFGEVSLGSHPFKAFTLRNVGGSTARGLTGDSLVAPFSFRGGSFPGFGTDCTNVLAAGAQCTFSTQFSPVGVADARSSARLSYQDGFRIQTLTLSLKGYGVEYSTLVFDESPSANFGTAKVGESNEHTLLVRHFGLYSATGVDGTLLSGGFSYKGGTYPGTGGTCGRNISMNCTIVAVFGPLSGGVASQSLRLTYFNGVRASDASITLTGTGVTVTRNVPAQLSLEAIDGSGGDFGTALIGSATRTKAFRIRNVGGQSATSIRLRAFERPQFRYRSECSGTLAVGDQCQFEVDFSSSVAIRADDIIRADYQDGVSAQNVSTSVRGFAANRAHLVIHGDGNFGDGSVGKPVIREFSVRNDDLSLSAPSIVVSLLAEDQGFKILSQGCTGALAGGSACPIVVQFLPSDLVNYQTELLAVYDQAQSGESSRPDTARLSLFGRGIDNANLSLSATCTFGAHAVGTHDSLKVDLSYDGGKLPATIKDISPIGPEFTYPGGFFPGGGDCPAKNGLLNKSCFIEVTFNPTEATQYDRLLKITYDDGHGDKSIETHCTGSGITAGKVVLTMAPSVFSDTKRGVASDLATITATNLSGNVSTVTLGATKIAPANDFVVVQGGSCHEGFFLAPGESCTYQVRFTPSVVGVRQALFSLRFNDGYHWSSETDPLYPPATLELKGKGYDAATLVFNPKSAKFLDQKVGKGTESIQLDLVNEGNGAATGIRLDFSELANQEITFENHCADGATLNSGERCDIRLNFTPTRPGKRTLTGGAWPRIKATYVDGINVDSHSEAEVIATAITDVKLRAGGDHTCAITRLGELKCWGRNSLGQLGTNLNHKSIGGTAGEMGDQLSAVDLGPGRYAIDMSLGAFHTCAVLDDHSLKCWGANDSGQLGGEPVNGKVAVELGQAVLDVDGAVSAGYGHTCALLADHSVKCWGLNAQGQLGLGMPDDIVRTPTAILVAGSISQVSAGASHTCVVSGMGELRCFGGNTKGQLGYDSGTLRTVGKTPAEINALLPINLGEGRRAVGVQASKGATTCVLIDDGSVKCFGNNLDVYNKNENIPESTGTLIKGMLGTFWKLNREEAAVPAWSPDAINDAGFYGSRVGEMATLTPVDLGAGFLGATSTSPSGRSSLPLSSGTYFSCLLATSGVKCWGDNISGQLGQGDATSRGVTASDMGAALHELVFGSAVAVQDVSAGNMHACALFEDQSIKCWGNNSQGQLGQGHTDSVGTRPDELKGLSPVSL